MPVPVELTRAIGIDAKCLRDKCEADHHLGYEMMKRFLPLLVGSGWRRRGCRLLDVYGKRRDVSQAATARPVRSAAYRVARARRESG